jgi:hypothetical protein
MKQHMLTHKKNESPEKAGGGGASGNGASGGGSGNGNNVGDGKSSNSSSSRPRSGAGKATPTPSGAPTTPTSDSFDVPRHEYINNNSSESSLGKWGGGDENDDEMRSISRNSVNSAVSSDVTESRTRESADLPTSTEAEVLKWEREEIPAPALKPSPVKASPAVLNQPSPPQQVSPPSENGKSPTVPIPKRPPGKHLSQPIYSLYYDQFFVYS